MQLTLLRKQDPATRTYLGSPSIIRIRNGDLLATHDYFGPGSPRDHEHVPHLTSVYRSSDEGRTWCNVTHISGAYWSTLFNHDNAVYLLGTSGQNGSIVIRRSEDDGNTWTHPADDRSGLLFRAGPLREPPNYHCAPTPVAVHQGRLYRAFEDCDPCVWGTGFLSCVISAPADAELLDASNWRMSDKTRFDRHWVPTDWGELSKPGVLEGNVVVTPSGGLWNILRLHSAPLPDKAVIMRVQDEGRTQKFLRWINMPGGLSKFTIRRDPETDLYYTLANDVPDRPEVKCFLQERLMCPRSRLSLYASANLVDWAHCLTVLEDDLDLSAIESLRQTGFQYADWRFDGRDILALVRTAYDGAHNCHDSNMITFHRLKDIRAFVRV